MVSDAELLEDIRRVADELGETPTKSEYQEMGEWSAQTVRSHFGSWNDALQEAGLTPTRGIPKDEIIEDIQRVKDELGQVPTSEEYTDIGSFSASTAINKFGSWKKAIRAAGFEPVGTRQPQVSKEELIDDLQRVANELGEAPSKAEYDRLGNWSTSLIIKRFDKWNNAIREANLSPTKIKSISKDELLADIQSVASKLDEAPTKREYKTRGEFSPSLAQEKFGSWNEALRAAGLEPRQRKGISDEEILKDLQRVANILQPDVGRSNIGPTVEEYERYGEFSKGTVFSHFPSWSAALREAGLEPPRELPTQVSTSELKRDLQRVARDLGRPPRRSEYKRLGKHSPETITGRFGGWNDALRAAGLLPENKTISELAIDIKDRMSNK